jgi:hypothetical protein
VTEFQPPDHDVVDVLRGEYETSHANFDCEPSRLAGDLDVQALVGWVEEEGILDHVGQTATDDGQLQILVALVDRIEADPLQRLAVVDEDLGHPTMRLVLVAALEPCVRKAFVAEYEPPARPASATARVPTPNPSGPRGRPVRP